MKLSRAISVISVIKYFKELRGGFDIAQLPR
jgi:hypothetical protein